MNTEFLRLEAVLRLVGVGLLALPTHQVDGGDDMLLVLLLRDADVQFEVLGEGLHVPQGADAVDDQAAVAAG